MIWGACPPSHVPSNDPLPPPPPNECRFAGRERIGLVEGGRGTRSPPSAPPRECQRRIGLVERGEGLSGEQCAKRESKAPLTFFEARHSPDTPTRSPPSLPHDCQRRIGLVGEGRGVEWRNHDARSAKAKPPLPVKRATHLTLQHVPPPSAHEGTLGLI